MPPSRLRFAWPALCVALIVTLAVANNHWRKKLRAASAQLAKKPKPKPVFDKRDTAYFRALAAMLGYDANEALKPTDAARLSAYDRIELNKLQALLRPGDPPTMMTPHLDFARRVALPLAPTMQFSLDGDFTHYRYELVNKSDRTLPAPILFQNERWDSAEALVAKAGFKDIADEPGRAIAIWRFVCAHRVFGDPPTEGKEEHDVLKFLGIYGYGFCDDSARAVSTLAELSGLRGRVWALEGHLVAEIMAGGRWRMFDADQQAYFHKAGAPQEILGVEELAADRAAFNHMVSFRDAGDYSPKYKDCFSTRENNKLDEGGMAKHRLQPTLRGGERMTFTNFNWGRYFLGKFPTPPPRFFNGSFTYTFHPSHLTTLTGKIDSEPIDGGHRLSNSGSEPASARLDFAYPFPIVGGLITAAATTPKGAVQLRLEDSSRDRMQYVTPGDRLRIDLDHFVNVLTAEPTYGYSVVFALEPGTVLELRNFTAASDFQFAPLPLVKLQPRANEVHAHFPEGTDPAAFELIISTK